MQLHQLKPKTLRQKPKRVGRGGKRGTFSGHGTKGQKSRAGSSVRPGFRGGDNRLWQLFPKQRGASKKPGNARVHRKHRHYQFLGSKAEVILNLEELKNLAGDTLITPEVLAEKGFISSAKQSVKVLGGEKSADIAKLNFKGVKLSQSAKTKVEKAGGSVK